MDPSSFQTEFTNDNYPKIYPKKSLLESRIWIKKSEKRESRFFRHFFLKTKPIKFKF